jgi:rhamnosyl/mannosyltransferase
MQSGNLKKKKNGIEILSFKYFFSIFSSPFSLDIIKYIFKCQKKFDIIHYHYPWPMIDLINLFINKNTKKIITYHADAISGNRIIDFFYSLITKFFLNKMDVIIVTSRNYLKSSKILCKYKKKIKIIPLGIEKRKSNKNFNFNEKNYILFVGSDRKYKGLNILINSSKQIKGSLVIAGNFKKNKFNNYKNLRFIKNPSNEFKDFLIKNCAFLILPSINRSEAFGVVLLEAAKFKKPVITTNINSGNTFIVKNKYNGLVIQPNNINELSAACNYLLQNKAKVKLFGKNNHKRFIKLFTAEKMINEYSKIYNKL